MVCPEPRLYSFSWKLLSKENRLKLAEDIEGTVEDVDLRLSPHVEDPEKVELVRDIIRTANLVRRHIRENLPSPALLDVGSWPLE